MEELRKNPRAIMAIGGLILVVIILAIMAIGGITINKETGEDGNIAIENAKIIKEIVNIQDEEDIYVQDRLLDIISSGESGLYTIGNRYFVVITTGDESSSIEYSFKTSELGSKITWKLMSQDDILSDDKKLSYAIIEVSNENITVEKEQNVFNESTLNGFYKLLIFKENNINKIYLPSYKRVLSINTLDIPGTYMGSFTSGTLDKCEKIDSISLKSCKVVSKVSQTNGLYVVDIESTGNNIEVYMDDINISNGTVLNLKISYDPVLGSFRGEEVHGII